jgi:hypothetical protein
MNDNLSVLLENLGAANSDGTRVLVPAWVIGG